jgi:hypothetical protein
MRSSLRFRRRDAAELATAASPLSSSTIEIAWIIALARCENDAGKRSVE